MVLHQAGIEAYIAVNILLTEIQVTRSLRVVYGLDIASCRCGGVEGRRRVGGRVTHHSRVATDEADTDQNTR